MYLVNLVFSRVEGDAHQEDREGVRELPRVVRFEEAGLLVPVASLDLEAGYKYAILLQLLHWDIGVDHQLKVKLVQRNLDKIT